MENRNKIEKLKKINFFHGLDDSELSLVSDLCGERTYKVGELCQVENKATNIIQVIVKGRVGSIVHIPNISYLSSEIILDPLHEGDAFGWSSLIKGTPWATLKVLDPTEVLFIDADKLVDLCESNNHIGYKIMKNLASLIASRLRRSRTTTLNTLIAIKGEG